MPAAKFHRAYAHAIEGNPDVRISHVTYDRTHTTAEDPNSWFPLAQLKRAAAEGRIGSVAPRFYGAPTTRSQRSTLEQDAPDILAFMRADKVDAAVLVPNCPVCHQTISLTARHLEAAGIPTVIMGCAKDIVEHAGVPRFLFSDFPLGNAAGKPHDAASQAATLDLALDLLESASAPRTTVQSPQRWSDDPSWKRDFDNVDVLSEPISPACAPSMNGTAPSRAPHVQTTARDDKSLTRKESRDEGRWSVSLRFHQLCGGGRSRTRSQVCHCTDCQILSEFCLPRQTVPAQHGTFKLLTGELKIYVKTAESGNRRVRPSVRTAARRSISAPAGGSHVGATDLRPAGRRHSCSATSSRRNRSAGRGPGSIG